MPDLWQRFRKRRQLVEFRRVSNFAPARMISILLASPGVTAGGLKMVIVVRCNPHVSPCRRDDQRSDPRQYPRVVHPSLAPVDVIRMLAAALAKNARHAVVSISQAPAASSFLGVALDTAPHHSHPR